MNVQELWHGRHWSPVEEDGYLDRRRLLAEVLLEIYEVEGTPGRYHYEPHDLLYGRTMDIKTIGPMSLADMRDFAKRQAAPEGTEWWRLR